MCNGFSHTDCWGLFTPLHKVRIWYDNKQSWESHSFDNTHKSAKFLPKFGKAAIKVTHRSEAEHLRRRSNDRIKRLKSLNSRKLDQTSVKKNRLRPHGAVDASGGHNRPLDHFKKQVGDWTNLRRISVETQLAEDTYNL